MRNEESYLNLFESQCQWSNLNCRAQKSLEPLWWLSAQMSICAVNWFCNIFVTLNSI